MSSYYYESSIKQFPQAPFAKVIQYVSDLHVHRPVQYLLD
jgi:hypothetical protein